MLFRSARRHPGVVNRAPLDVGRTAGDPDHDPGPRERRDRLLMRPADKITQHRLRNFKLGYDPVAHRSNHAQVRRRPPHHFFRLRADRDRLPGALFDRNPRRLVNNDPLAADVNKRVGGSKVDPNI